MIAMAFLLAAALLPQFRELAARPGPLWIAYTVPSVTANAGGGCARSSGKVYLEGARQIRVFYRVEQGKVGRIRLVSPECEIDDGGLPVHIIPDVNPAESVALLESFTAQNDKTAESAVGALALHADPAADAALDRLTASASPPRLREKAVFWLGAARGRPGFDRLRKIVREDPSERIREKAVFGLHVSRQPEAVDAMIDAARNDKSPRVRGQALFWLGQKAGEKAAAAIGDAVTADPDTEVKKRAIFALKQLPNGEGIPLLIQVAKANRNPEVRKQAMFWLGQSRDPRALAFFEQVLK